MDPLQPPLGWAEDTLSEFIETAHRNRFATYANKGDWFQKLSKLDRCFVRIAGGWVNPADMIAALLFFSCHSSFRVACEQVLAGNVGGVFPQIRVCLEYAAYALHLHKHPDLGEAWLNRHENEDAMKVVRKEFQVSNIRETVEAANRKAGDVFQELYQRAIDFGAHPNERAITGNLAINQQDGRKEFSTSYLHGDGIMLNHALKTTAQTGVCALEILQETFPARFELLGVRSDLLLLRRGL